MPALKNSVSTVVLSGEYCFFIALTLCGVFPPPNPVWNGFEVWEALQANPFLSKLAVIVGILGSGFAMPFNALIAGHIFRIESENGVMPLLTFTSLIGGICNIVAFLLCFYSYAPMFYRAAPSMEVVQFVNDYIWLIIVMAFSAPALQMLVIATAGFRDKSERPVFPRAYNFAMLWFAFGTCTGTIAIYFFSGPFAWNGLIGFWIPAFTFCAWLFSLSYFYLKYANAQES